MNTENTLTEMMNDIEISGVNLIFDHSDSMPSIEVPITPVNRTVLFAPPAEPKTEAEFEREAENAKYALRFKTMLLQQEPDFRIFILNKCAEWVRTFAPTEVDVIDWFTSATVALVPMALHQHASALWNTLYNTICNKHSFRRAVAAFDDLME
jgi:hypothetical protein